MCVCVCVCVLRRLSGVVWRVSCGVVRAFQPDTYAGRILWITGVRYMLDRVGSDRRGRLPVSRASQNVSADGSQIRPIG